MRLAFLTLIPRAKSFLCRCVVMALSKRARTVILVRETVQRAVIHKLANSELEPCVTRVVRLVVQVIVGLRRARSCAGSPGMIGVTRPSFVPVTRQRVQQISLCQTVRSLCFSNPDRSYTSLRPKLWDWRASVRQRYLHVIGLCVSFVP
jgi:hypothetical protein